MFDRLVLNGLKHKSESQNKKAVREAPRLEPGGKALSRGAHGFSLTARGEGRLYDAVKQPLRGARCVHNVEFNRSFSPRTPLTRAVSGSSRSASCVRLHVSSYKRQLQRSRTRTFIQEKS